MRGRTRFLVVCVEPMGKRLYLARGRTKGTRDGYVWMTELDDARRFTTREHAERVAGRWNTARVEAI